MTGTATIQTTRKSIMPKHQKTQEKDYALYVGRLSNEKGVQILLKAWQRLGKADRERTALVRLGMADTERVG